MMRKDVLTSFNVPVIVGVIKGHTCNKSNEKNTEDHSGYSQKFIIFFEHWH